LEVVDDIVFGLKVIEILLIVSAVLCIVVDDNVADPALPTNGLGCSSFGLSCSSPRSGERFRQGRERRED
jgi:hypothetical protein